MELFFYIQKFQFFMSMRPVPRKSSSSFKDPHSRQVPCIKFNALPQQFIEPHFHCIFEQTSLLNVLCFFIIGFGRTDSFS